MTALCALAFVLIIGSLAGLRRDRRELPPVRGGRGLSGLTILMGCVV